MGDTIEEEARRIARDHYGTCATRQERRALAAAIRIGMRREREAVVRELAERADAHLKAGQLVADSVLAGAIGCITDGDHHPGGDPLKE